MKEYEKKIYRSRLDIDNISREGYLVEVEYGWKQNRGGGGKTPGEIPLWIMRWFR